MAISALTIQIPTQWTAGDIAAMVMISDQSITLPSGWTSVRNAAAGGFVFLVSRRTLVAADLGSLVTWTLGGSTNKCTFNCFDLQGVTGIDVTTHHLYTSPTTTLTVPSVTTNNDGDLLILFWGAAGECNMSAPSPDPATDLGGDYVRGNITLQSMAYTQATAGATSAISVTLDTAQLGAAVQFALRGSNPQIPFWFGGGLG